MTRIEAKAGLKRYMAASVLSILSWVANCRTGVRQLPQVQAGSDTRVEQGQP